MNSKLPELDLVDQMEFEDIPELFVSLEDAGLEDKPVYDNMFGAQKEYYNDESN